MKRRSYEPKAILKRWVFGLALNISRSVRERISNGKEVQSLGPPPAKERSAHCLGRGTSSQCWAIGENVQLTNKKEPGHKLHWNQTGAGFWAVRGPGLQDRGVVIRFVGVSQRELQLSAQKALHSSSKSGSPLSCCKFGASLSSWSDFFFFASKNQKEQFKKIVIILVTIRTASHVYVYCRRGRAHLNIPLATSKAVPHNDGSLQRH